MNKIKNSKTGVSMPKKQLMLLKPTKVATQEEDGIDRIRYD